MKSTNEGAKMEVKMELKYCERCGGLWLRECGAGVVYCDHCRLEVAQLPPPKENRGRAVLPVQRRSVIDQYELDDDELTDFEAAGGAA